MQDLLDSKLARSLNNVQRALNIRIHIRVRGMIRIGNSNQSGKVYDEIATPHGFANAVRVANVSSENIQAFAYFLRRPVKPSP